MGIHTLLFLDDEAVAVVLILATSYLLALWGSGLSQWSYSPGGNLGAFMGRGI